MRLPGYFPARRFSKEAQKEEGWGNPYEFLENKRRPTKEREREGGKEGVSRVRLRQAPCSGREGVIARLQGKGGGRGGRGQRKGKGKESKRASGQGVDAMGQRGSFPTKCPARTPAATGPAQARPLLRAVTCVQ